MNLNVKKTYKADTSKANSGKGGKGSKDNTQRSSLAGRVLEICFPVEKTPSSSELHASQA